MLEQFIAKSEPAWKTFASQRDYLNEIKENSGKYEIFDAGINSRTQITVVLITITPTSALRYRWSS
jgi:hypothetical protein